MLFAHLNHLNQDIKIASDPAKFSQKSTISLKVIVRCVSGRRNMSSIQ